MSKVGRMPIPFTSAKVTVNGSKVLVDGGKVKFEHDLPEAIKIAIEDKVLRLTITEDTRQNRMLWGLHRALLANKVFGVEKGFETKLIIVGLGFKVVQAGTKLTFSLGYTHKIDYELPAGVAIEIDKSGQILILKSADKFLLGNVADTIRSFRPPEPYKGTGIMYEGEKIHRKAGKTKSS
ncbi:50S ribosomal protein L6 [Candidatus Dependentiae bacterium]|nr:50S ribosomal protein L6 [Candidatus Dependentiae bacterium]